MYDSAVGIVNGLWNMTRYDRIWGVYEYELDVGVRERLKADGGGMIFPKKKKKKKKEKKEKKTRNRGKSTALDQIPLSTLYEVVSTRH